MVIDNNAQTLYGIPLVLISEEYNRLLAQYNVRTHTVLSRLREEVSSDREFFRLLLLLSDLDIYHLPQCGRQTSVFIKELLDSLHSYVGIPYVSSGDNHRDKGLLYLSLSLPAKQQFNEMASELDCLVSKLSVRAFHSFEQLKKDKYYTPNFFRRLMSLSDKDILRLYGCGTKTLEELTQVLQGMHEKFDLSFIDGFIDCDDGARSNLIVEPLQQPQNPSSHIPKEKHQAIDDTAPIVIAKVNTYPARVKNVFLQLYEDHHKSLMELLDCVSNPTFKVETLKNLGRGSFADFKECLEFFKQHIEMVAAMESDQLEWTVREISLRNLGVNEDSMPFIKDYYESNGRFPLFAILKSVLESLPSDSPEIISKVIPIYRDQEISSREELESYFNCTYERIRQKRNKLIEDFPVIFASLSALPGMDECPYRYQMNNIDVEVNALEETNFNLNFVNFALGSIYEDVSLAGEVFETLTNKKEHFIVAVPSELTKYFDFQAYIQNIRELTAKQRKDEEKIELKDLIEKHVKVSYYEDCATEIEKSCRSIIYLFFNLEIEYGKIYFPANAYKPAPEILEDIIRKAGHPLTIDELIDAYADLYPERDSDPIKVRANALRNKNIRPISRDGIYTLAEWQTGTKRGGTIRSYVDEFLDALPEPIASVEDVCEYIRQYRPNLSEESLQANLMQHSERRYNIYFKEEQRFIGLSDYEFSEEYIPYSPETSHRRTLKESIQLYDKFVSEHGFTPRYSGEGVTEEEKRLARFINVQNSKMNKGLLSEEEILMVEEMKERYAHLNSSRTDTFWLKWFDQVSEAVRKGETLSDKLQKWLTENMQQFYSRSLREWQMNKMRELLKLMSDLGTSTIY